MKHGCRVSVIVCYLLLLGFPVAIMAEDLTQDVRQGQEHYVKGEYEEALQSFLRAVETDPENAEIHYRIGLTYQGMRDYPKAEQSFKRAVEIDPSMGDAWSHLGEMLYRKGSHEEARQALDKARANGARPAYTAYITGLVLMELGKYDEAIAALQTSQKTDPAFRQKATYAIGMVYSRKNDKKAAEKAFREAIAINPRSVVGVYADFGLQYLHKPQRRLWHLDLSYSFQYDDNVILNPGGISALPTDQNDFKHVFNLHAGYKPETSGSLGFRADANYYKSLHHKLSHMDIDGFGLSMTPSYSTDAATFSLEGRLDYYLVGRNHYLNIYSIYPSIGFDIGNNQHGILNGVVQKKNFFNQALNIAAEDRDATNISAGYMHYVYVQNQQGYVGLGYAFDYENTRGANWDYNGHRIIASVLYPFGNGFGFRFNGDYYLQKYRNIHTLFGLKRDDKILTLSPVLTYDMNWATLQLQYAYVRANSNIGIYDYSRNIVGVGFEFSY
jgi:tetratricopeptide (TPR) repeat protein